MIAWVGLLLWAAAPFAQPVALRQEARVSPASRDGADRDGGFSGSPLEATEPSDGADRADGLSASDAGVAESSSNAEHSRHATVVTGTRSARPIRDVPSSVTVLPREEIDRSPALTTDALVRSIPSVATFRRNTSLVADPTSQGLNLRGIGPSGVSRALLLLDGAPVNEPFGNWIFWRAYPRLGIERIEVAPGPGSALYGSSALGGVVQLIPRPLTERTFDADLVAGTMGTLELAGRATHRWDKWGAGLEGELLRSDGFVIVSPETQGAVDRTASGAHGTFSARTEYHTDQDDSVGARVTYFDQGQNGGTEFTNSSIRFFEAALRGDVRTSAGQWRAALFFRNGTFTQQRARLTADRSEEVLSAEQRVPTHDLGGSLVWERAFQRHQLAAGLDLRRAVGRSDETLFAASPGPSTLTRRDLSGEQQFFGFFLQDELKWDRAVLAGTVRYDLWRNLAGTSVLERFDGSQESSSFPDRLEHSINPRLGALVRLSEGVALRSTVGTAFRVPTLNELYRPFQVGTVRTAANDALQPERLIGGELGLEVEPRPAWVTRVTGHFSRLENPVVNVTLPAPLDDGSQRQRQNLGAVNIYGLDASLEGRIAPRWTFLLSYGWVRTAVVSAPGNGQLLGKELNNAPQHRGTVGVTFDQPTLFTTTVQVRVLGPHFEDDLNELELGGYALVDISVSRKLVSGLELFAAGENLLNRRYLVGRAGIDTYGAPLTFRGGLRWRAP
jgi:outer membrane receptor protein involved in Fe transport